MIDLREVYKSREILGMRANYSYINIDIVSIEYSISAVDKSGLFLEFGVAGGESLKYMQSLFPQQVFHGFDSFWGNPEDWFDCPKGKWACQIPDLGPNVELHVGMFESTLPKFVKEYPEPIAYLDIDCDIYSSTKTIFKYLKNQCQVGTVVRLGQLIGYPGFEYHQFKALNEFLDETGFDVEILCHSEYCVGLKLKGTEP